MINFIDFMQDIVQILRATKEPAQKAAIVAELIFNELPEAVAFAARRCVLFHWFDLSVIEALLQFDLPHDEIKNVYENIIALPFIEKLPWGFAFQDLTREGLLKQYASTLPDILRTSALRAASIYAAHPDEKIVAEALFCYAVAGDRMSSQQLMERMTQHALEKGDTQFIINLQSLLNEAQLINTLQSLPNKVLQKKFAELLSEELELEALLAASANPISIKRGDVVEGVIVRIDQDKILVDIGLKSEGVLSTKELPASGYGSFGELHLNDRVLVYVIQPETPEGHAVLSLKRANTERQWRIAEVQYKNEELLKAKVIDFNKGGLIVDVNGIRGFVPISQILNLKREEVASGGESQETAAKLQSMKDKELQLKIIEINRARNRLILSERLAVQEWRQRRREELLDELKPGEVRKGIVSNLANFGAFVDLGGADGLVHISQLAWSRVNHPSEVLHVGQEVEVQVLSVDKDKKKIALSIKRAEVDPWTTVEQRYQPGQLVTGVVTKTAPFGAFARIEDGIEGLIHQSELTPGTDAKAVLHEGAQLQLRILRIDAERRRLGLSQRQVDEPEEKEASAEAQVEQDVANQAPSEAGAPTPATPSLENLSQHQEHAPKRERGERRERSGDSSLLGRLPDEGETTAMAEAFRAAARQRSKEENEISE